FGLRGHLPLFIQHFMTDRSFSVRIGQTCSDSFRQDMGVPQGSVLSVTLFAIKINSIVSCLNSGITGTLFVDDFSISCCSRNMDFIERQLQQCLHRLESWSNHNGFKFSSSKTVCMHFCKLRRFHPNPTLYLSSIEIPVVKEFKFLGLVFDPQLSYLPHIKYLVTKCKRSLDILRVLASTQWGCDRDTLLTIYRLLIRSKLDYGSIIYGATRHSYLRYLNSIHHSGLRLSLGAFRTTPIDSLYAAAHEPSLGYRRLQLSLDYITRLRANPDNPAYSCVFSPPISDFYDTHQSLIPPFGVNTLPHFEASNIPSTHILPQRLPHIPPWFLYPPPVDLSLHDYLKTTTSPLVYRSLFAEVRDRYPSHTPIYTDGSKDTNCAAAAAFFEGSIFSSRLPDFSSIYSAELHAILLVLPHLFTSTSNDFILFSDSLSSLQALSHFNIKNPLILQIIELYHTLQSKGKSLIFCWIPGHTGILGNEIADRAAKLALLDPIAITHVPYHDFRPLIQQYIHSFRQSEWALQVTNKLHTTYPQLGAPFPVIKFRRDDVVICRLRLGHTWLTHSHLLSSANPPMCSSCKIPMSVAHILLLCPSFNTIRSNYYSVSTLTELFQSIHYQKILGFLHAIHLYNSI
ncbi:ribonuclease H family protein, partial [Solemya velum gill symbiont]